MQLTWLSVWQTCRTEKQPLQLLRHPWRPGCSSCTLESRQAFSTVEACGPSHFAHPPLEATPGSSKYALLWCVTCGRGAKQALDEHTINVDAEMKAREAGAAQAEERAHQQLEEAATEAKRLRAEAAEQKAAAEERLAAFEALKAAAQQEAASHQQKFDRQREALNSREDTIRAQEAELLAAKSALEVASYIVLLNGKIMAVGTPEPFSQGL